MADKKITVAQDIVWRLEALGFDIFTAAMRMLGLERASAFGGWLLRTLGPLGGTHRLARRNIELAFPEKDVAWREQVLADQWENLGRAFAEFPLMDQVTVQNGRVEVDGIEQLQAITAGGRAVVFISGHLSNWEVMPIAIFGAGVTCQITYRAANNPYVDKRFKESRRRYGVRLFAPKGSDGSRELLNAMAKGESVALMNDQKFNGGVAAPFFGRLAHTSPGPTRLALRFGTVLQPLSVTRLDGVRFRITVHPPIDPAVSGDRGADIAAGVAAVNAFVEARIREHPSEWFWVHKRWANAVYDGMEEVSLS